MRATLSSKVIYPIMNSHIVDFISNSNYNISSILRFSHIVDFILSISHPLSHVSQTNLRFSKTRNKFNRSNLNFQIHNEKDRMSPSKKKEQKRLQVSSLQGENMCRYRFGFVFSSISQYLEEFLPLGFTPRLIKEIKHKIELQQENISLPSTTKLR